MRPSRLARLALLVLAILVLIGLGSLLVVRQILVASLAQTDGTRVLPGLTAPVRVDRDALGIPTIRGANRQDVARATGFVHAQERFFEMDMARRFAAGELSEVIGRATLAVDRAHRIHRMRAMARTVLARARPGERALLEAYADGVNQGLAALGARPPEYLPLRSRPAAWLPEDSVLVVGTMFENDLVNSRRELELQAMYDALPAPLVDFLRPLGDEWDAPLAGGAIVPAPMPGRDVFDLRRNNLAEAVVNNPAKAVADNPAKAGSHKTSSIDMWDPPSGGLFAGNNNGSIDMWDPPSGGLFAGNNSGSIDMSDPPSGGLFDGNALPWAAFALTAGSNACAIAGSHTADGRALVANDPHLPLQVPNIWYRLSLDWRDEGGIRHRMTGASLPGLPFVAIGSSDRVAWGFTVAFDDRSDMVSVEIDAARPQMYRTPDGWRPFGHSTEWIKVKGARDERLDITSTIWGPIVGRDSHGHPLAQQWQPHHADGVNLAFADIESATSVEQALDIANRSGMPSYNIIAADDRGSIGWTVTGRLPKRVGFDGRVPASWADGTRRWDGWLEPGDYPRIVNPASGRLWSSNNRPVGRPLLDRLGLEGYVMGPRARQVRDDLAAREGWSPRDVLEVQLDDRALFLGRWRRFLLEQVPDRATGVRPSLREFRRLLEKSWDGHASVASVGYLLVRRCRAELARRAIGPLMPAGFSFRPDALLEWWESALWRLVHERPMHLLAPQWHDWDDLVAAAVDATVAGATAGGRPLAEANWGSTTRIIQHPIARAVPFLSGWLDMPFAPLPGDRDMPRLRMRSSAGEVSATLRMVVSPGRQTAGIFHMPCGESGHPLSPHYRDMQSSWVEGQPTPFLPGPTVETLTLLPARSK